MKTIAFIFARGGSKGLPSKNIKPLAGKPLIAWSIEHALAVPRIERVIVSTDSHEIANISRKFGAEVPFVRPDILSGDKSSEWLAWQHALNFLLENESSLPDVMVSIPATAPLRLPIDIENCLDEFEKGCADAVITVTESHRSPYFNMVKENNDGTVGLVIPSKSPFSQRQDVPEVFDMTTVAYVLRPDFVIKNQSIFEGKVRAVNIPLERSIDIDTLIDFRMAEFFMQINKHKVR